MVMNLIITSFTLLRYIPKYNCYTACFALHVSKKGMVLFMCATSRSKLLNVNIVFI